ATVRSLDYFAARGFPPDDIFDLHGARPIELRAQFGLDEGDLDVVLSLTRHEDELLIKVVRLTREDGTELAEADGSKPETERSRLLEQLGPRRRGDAIEPRFALIRADRTIAAEPAPKPEEASPLATREPLPRDL